MMYNDIYSTIINNGNTGGYFKLEKGYKIFRSVSQC